MTASQVREGTEPNGAWAQSARSAFRFLFLAVCFVAIIWSLSGIRQVPPESRAIVYQFGKIVRQQSAGLLLAWPRPIEQVVILPSADRQIEFKIDDFEPGSNPTHTVFQIARFNSAFLLTGDTSIVHLEATLFYQIVDPAAYILTGDHLNPALRRLFVASTVEVCAARDLDAILVARPELATNLNAAAGADREQLRADLVRTINQKLDDLSSVGSGLGVLVSRIDLTASIPNGAKDAFDRVLVAAQDAERDIADARTDAADTAQLANQDHDRILSDADAKAAERTTEAATRTAAIDALARGSHGLSGVTLANRMYFDRIGTILGKAGHVDTVDHGGGINLILPGSAPQ